MIIDVRQTASNIAQRFDVYCDDVFSYVGELGRFFRIQNICLENVQGDIALKASFQMQSLKNYIPFGSAFGCKQHRQCFSVYREEQQIASFAYRDDGVLKHCYKICLDERVYMAYWRSCGDYQYVMIYRDKQQVGMIETLLSVCDNKYHHRLYLLDECARDSEVLTLFVLYYSNYHFAKRFHMQKSVTIVKSWSFTRYDDKIDLSWKNEHFGDKML